MKNQDIPYSLKSDKIGVPVKVFTFKSGEMDLWITLDHWNAVGGYRGVIKEMALCIRDIERVHSLIVNPNRIPTNEWPG